MCWKCFPLLFLVILSCDFIGISIPLKDQEKGCKLLGLWLKLPSLGNSHCMLDPTAWSHITSESSPTTWGIPNYSLTWPGNVSSAYIFICRQLTGSFLKACGNMDERVSHALVCRVGWCSFCRAVVSGPLNTSDQNWITCIITSIIRIVVMI